MRNIDLPCSTAAAFALAFLCGSLTAHAQAVEAFNPGANQTVNTIALQPDGKIVIGGNFTALGGVTGTTTRNHVGRLNVDGTVDSSFNPGTNGPLLAIAVQPDGKILAGGNFTAAGGGTGLASPRSRIARFNPDGTLDAGFDPGASLNVSALAIQADGKILVGGSFSRLGGGGTGVTTRIAIGRLNADGSIDATFNPGASKVPVGAVPIVYSIVVQPDGRILVGGYFNGLGGGTGATTRNFIGRLNADGTVDGGFNPGASSIAGVTALALQADGRILVGGSFTGLGAGTGLTLRQNIGRLNPDGTVDAGFNPGAESQILALGVQTDGKILAGGYFKWLGGQGGPSRSERNHFGRFNPDGSVDGGFGPGADNVVNAVALQGDGAVVLGGIFSGLGGVAGATPRGRIGRITNSTPGVQKLALSSGDTVATWLRSGGGPEVSRVTFELSVGNGPYSPIGSGTRVAGGWTLSGLTLPRTPATVRARGYYDTGQNGSGSIAQSDAVRSRERSTAGDYDGDGKADLVVYRPSTSTWYTRQSADGSVADAPFGISTDVPAPGDYDGDGRGDYAVYRPATGTWYIRNSSGSTTIVQWGLDGDIPVPADFDGDQLTDLAVYRPSTGVWYIRESATSTLLTVTAGAAGEVPVPGDYDGDGKADIALFRLATGEWFIRRSIDLATVSYQFGLAGDVPVPGDYDGDGRFDVAVYRPASSMWYILQSASGFTGFVAFQWGLNGDLAEPADYDGDGKFDLAVYRPSTGDWYIGLSATGYATTTTAQLGLSGDTPVPGALVTYAITRVRSAAAGVASLTTFSDFDGDDKADLTVFRPATGTWFTQRSAGNYTTFTSTQFGLNGDVPVPGDYDADGKTDVAVFRPTTGTWYILNSLSSSVAAYQWGLPGDIPIPGDYDGDGRTDSAVYRPGAGTWYIRTSADAGLVSYQWGLAGDIPVPGDYDGDGRSDIAVYRPGAGTWHILRSTTSYLIPEEFQFGLNGDIAVPGDFDGDRRTDLAVWRPSSGTWFIHQSTTGALLTLQFGLDGDIPVAGDYDGDGRTDPAVFRTATGTWFRLQSTTNFTSSVVAQWGLPGDIPILKRP